MKSEGVMEEGALQGRGPFTRNGEARSATQKSPMGSGSEAETDPKIMCSRESSRINAMGAILCGSKVYYLVIICNN